MASEGKMQELDVDSILPLVREFSRFQYVLEALLCISIIPQALQEFMMYFAAHNSPWRCTYNSTVCTFPQNMTFSSGDSLYEERCKLERKEWEFVYAKDYSIMTQVCNCFIFYSFQLVLLLAIISLLMVKRADPTYCNIQLSHHRTGWGFLAFIFCFMLFHAFGVKLIIRA